MPSRWSRPELAGDEVVLGRLGVVERHAVVDEAGARVRHRLAEDDPVEVVADVVVVADRPRVAAQRVAPTLQPRLLRRRRQRPPDHSGASAPRRSPRSPPCSRKRRSSAVTSRSASTMAMKSPSASRSPATYARPRPSWLGIHSNRRMASGELTRSVPGDPPRPGGPVTVDDAAVPELDAYRGRAPEQRPQQRCERFGDGPRLDVCSHASVVAHRHRPMRQPSVTTNTAAARQASGWISAGSGGRLGVAFRGRRSTVRRPRHRRGSAAVGGPSRPQQASRC